MSSQLRHVSIVRKKLVNKQQHLPTCLHNTANILMVELLAAEIDSLVWCTPANVNGFRVLTVLLQRRRSTEANQTLHDVCRLLGWCTMYRPTFSGLLPRNGILPGAKFTLRPSLAFSYISSVTARHFISGRQSNFAALSRRRRLYLAGRPSRWASAHILVSFFIRIRDIVTILSMIA